MFRLAAEPNLWIKVTAPVSAVARLRPACLSRNPALARAGDLVGSVKRKPKDLSTNPKLLRGFGR
jgi:hypothetical protein